MKSINTLVFKVNEFEIKYKLLIKRGI
jgi:hypothetical protein